MSKAIEKSKTDNAGWVLSKVEVARNTFSPFSLRNNSWNSCQTIEIFRNAQNDKLMGLLVS